MRPGKMTRPLTSMSCSACGRVASAPTWVTRPSLMDSPPRSKPPGATTSPFRSVRFASMVPPPFQLPFDGRTRRGDTAGAAAHLRLPLADSARGAAQPAPTGCLGEHHGYDEGCTVKEVLHVCLGTKQLQAGNPGDEEVHRDQSAQDVEPARGDGGCPEERGSEGR